MLMTLATDENFDYGILRGLLRKLPGLDLVLAQDAGMTGADDPQVLEWAAAENRVLLTHDAQTMPVFAYKRVEKGDPMPGVIVVPQNMAIGDAIEELVLIIECCLKGELIDRVLRLPI